VARQIGNPLTELPTLPEVESRFDGIATAIRSVATAVETRANLESRFDAIATAVQSAAVAAESTVESKLGELTGMFDIPDAISIGTRDLCFKYTNESARCEKLPLNISALLPGDVSSLFSEEIQQLQKLQDSITTVTLNAIWYTTIAGLGLVITAAGIFHIVISRYHASSRRWRMTFAVLPDALCLMSSVIPTTLLFTIKQKLTTLVPTEISELVSLITGDASKYSLGSLIITLLMAVTAGCTIWRTPVTAAITSK
jgi:hypothetical protein